MSDLRTILERGVGGATPPPDGFDRMLRRRDRKRRNQRIAAGVVGVAVFVAAVGIVMSGLSFDRSETPAVPGPAETGPAAQASVGTVTFDGSTCSIEFTADRIEPGVVVFDIVNARGAPTTFDAWKLMDGYTFREFERAVEKATPAPGERRQEAFPGDPKIAYLASEYSPSNGSGTLVTTLSPGTHAIVCLTAIDLRAFDTFMRPVGIAGPIVVGTGQTETGPAETGPTALEPAVPLPGIPPDGATPSFPETGELVLSVSGWSNAAEGALTHVFVYADGRLIWSRDGGLSEGADGYHPGLVEQRLTPEGAEIMRSEVISSGLIHPPDFGIMVGGEGDPDPIPFTGSITFRDADRLVTGEFAPEDYATGAPHIDGERTCVEGWGCAYIATAEDEATLERLDARLADPASWLPASAWADQEIRAYVPSRYRVCYGGTRETIERDRVLHAIPGPVQELLEAKDAENERFVEVPFGAARVTGYCSELTTEEARDVVRGLDDGGFEREQLPTWNENSLVGDEHAHATFEYFFSVPDLVATATLTIDPYLPHGAAICLQCS